MAIGSIVCGVLALLMTVGGFLATGVPVIGSVLSFGAPALGLTGVILGGISLSRAKQAGESEGAALSGLIISIIGFLLGLLVALTCGLCNACMTASVGGAGAAAAGAASGGLPAIPMPPPGQGGAFPAIDDLQLEMAREELEYACADPCPEDLTCARPWCSHAPGLKVHTIECFSPTHCFVGAFEGERVGGGLHALEVRVAPGPTPAFMGALDAAIRARGQGIGGQIEPPNAAEQLRMLDSTCADVWCEGIYDYRFRSLQCGDQKCVIGITAEHYDDSSPMPTQIVVPRSAVSRDDEMLDIAVGAALGAYEVALSAAPHGMPVTDVAGYATQVLSALNDGGGFDESGFRFRFTALTCDSDPCSLAFTVQHQRLGVNRDETMPIPRNALRRNEDGDVADSFYEVIGLGMERWMEQNFDEP